MRKLTTPTKTDNQFYVRLVTDESLKKPAVRILYKMIALALPSGVLSSIQVERPGYGLDTVRLIHKTGEAGSHVYEIPLTRNLTGKEFTKVELAVAPVLTAGQSVQSSGIEPLKASQKPVETPPLEPVDFDVFCDTLAKYQHAVWYKQKIDAGWRYGLEHNITEKVNPMIRPWHELPEGYRRVDKRFPNEIFNILENLGYVIVPEAELKKLLKKKR